MKTQVEQIEAIKFKLTSGPRIASKDIVQLLKDQAAEIDKLRKNHEITVVERMSDYMAFIDGDEAMWGCGKDPRTAVASAIYSHQKEVGLKITEKFPPIICK